MIDTNELRRLAQAAISKMNALDPEFVSSVTPLAVLELLDRLEAAEKDIARKEKVIDALGSELNAVAKERDALRAMLWAALDVLEEVKGNINPERGYADELEADVERAIATIVIPGAKGE